MGEGRGWYFYNPFQLCCIIIVVLPLETLSLSPQLIIFSHLSFDASVTTSRAHEEAHWGGSIFSNSSPYMNPIHMQDWEASTLRVTI